MFSVSPALLNPCSFIFLTTSHLPLFPIYVAYPSFNIVNRCSNDGCYVYFIGQPPATDGHDRRLSRTTSTPCITAEEAATYFIRHDDEDMVVGKNPFLGELLLCLTRNISPSVGPSVRRSVGPSVRRSVGPSVRRSVGPSVRRSVGPSGPSVRRSVGPSVRRSVGPSVRPFLHVIGVQGVT